MEEVCELSTVECDRIEIEKVERTIKLPQPERPVLTDQQRRSYIKRNFMYLCLISMLNFQCYYSFISVHLFFNVDQRERGIDLDMGTYNLISLFVTLVLTSMFASTMMVKKLGFKSSILCGQLCLTIYVCAHLYPKWYFLIPASMVLGVGLGPLWVAILTCIYKMAEVYSKLNDEKLKVVVYRLFGIFFAFYQMAYVGSSVISSFVLRSKKMTSKPVRQPMTNRTYCDQKHCFIQEIVDIKPVISDLLVMCLINLIFMFISVVMVTMFFDDDKINPLENVLNLAVDQQQQPDSVQSNFKLLTSTLNNFKMKKQLLVIPITCWMGLSQAFIIQDYNRWFVSCSKSVYHVRWAIVLFGVSDSLANLMFGFGVKYVGRVLCWLIPAFLNYAVLFLMIFWTPNKNEHILLYLIPLLWAFSDAGWIIQINSTYALVFESKSEEAFSSLKLWESFSYSLAFAYSKHICISSKLFFLLGILTLGLVGCLLLKIKQDAHSSIVPQQSQQPIQPGTSCSLNGQKF